MKKGLSVPSGLVAFQSRRISLNISSRTIPAAGAVAFAVLAAAWVLQPDEKDDAQKSEDAAAAVASAASASTSRYGGLLVNLRAAARMKSAAAAPETLPTPYAANSSELRLSSAGEAPTIIARLEPAAPQFPLPPQKPDELQAQDAAPAALPDAPQPPRRPTGLAPAANLPATMPPVRSAGRQARQALALARPAPVEDNRSFLEKVFGGFGGPSQPQQQQPPGRSLAYAAPEGQTRSGVTNIARSAALPTSQRYDRYTAIYDISAHTVYLPDGQRLEAHSGLGQRLDDPRYVHEKMHGATPPNVYELTLREALFHGVQALRLTPVGGQTVYGRAGLLAHTYMLGPNGDSNGCVSFRDYGSFLRAYQNGEVKRLAVVARLD